MTNFGDELSRDVVEEVSGRKVTWSKPEAADILAIGSIIELAVKEGANDCLVWGSGLRQPPTPEIVESFRARNIHFAAVRGPKTKMGLGLPGNTVIGDPGLLAPALAPDKVGKNFERLLIPHFSMWFQPAGRQLLRQAENAGYHIIAPTLAPREVIRAVARAESVFSSSLHGLIVADSLGVPAVQVSPPLFGRPDSPGYSIERDFKYSDYAASVNLSRASLAFVDLLSVRSAKALTIAESSMSGLTGQIDLLSKGLVATLKANLS